VNDEPRTQSAQERLWAGIDLKYDHAQFHFEKMSAALSPPKRTAIAAAIGSDGGVVAHDWQRPFYAHLDAFLSAARSIPELIRCCFGFDPDKRMKNWFMGLSADERERRERFSERFAPSYRAFRELPLGTARHDSEHRKGYPPASVTTIGLLGVTYKGDPITRLPASETRSLPGEYGFLERPLPIRPLWSDFQIGGAPLFETCKRYLEQSRALIEEARVIAQEVHDQSTVTPPESEA
jgi:hypothetical protein